MIESIDHAFSFWLSIPVDVWNKAKHRFLWLLNRKVPGSLALRSLRVTLLLVGILAILGSPRIAPPAAAQGEPAPAAEEKTQDERPTSEAPQPPPPTKSSQSKEKLAAPKPRKLPNSARVYETEPRPITVSGLATDQLGRPIAGATAYLAVANNFGKFGPDAVLAQSTSDAKGRFTFSDAPLPVRLFPPPPELIEGKFQVFGTAQGYGFTWHGLRSYRPRPHPEPNAETDMDRSFYQDEAIECPLVFGPAAKVQGRVTDDLGRPLVGAKIQVGVYDDLRRKGGYNWQIGLLETDGQATASPDLNFDRITSLPESFRSIVTDADGRFVIDGLPQRAEFLAQVAYRPEFDALSTKLATAAVGRDGTIALGAAGEWNPVLIAPRRVEVLLRYADSRLPAANAVVHARGERRIPLGGAEAKTDGDGKAVVHLTPGKYLLTTEPPFDADYVRSFLEYVVMSKPAEQSTELSIEP
ncbi:MAG TPA: hypothetical protein VND64_07375, partial [Pirellulales bacterium]|nr:hypothetical protein [Pirellulales bacterium]